MNKIIRNIVLVLLIFSFCKVDALVSPTSDFYVNDYANILSPETEEFVIKYSRILEEKTKSQIVVVTINSLEGKTVEEYANELFRSFGIGDEEIDNGLLILIAKEERKFRIEVGYGLEGVLPDGKVGRYRDEYMKPYLLNDDFDNAVVNVYKAFYNEISDYYGIDEGHFSMPEVKIKTFFQMLSNYNLMIFPILGGLFSIYFRNYVEMKKKEKKKKRKRKKKMDIFKIIEGIIFIVLIIINIILAVMARETAIILIPLEIIFFIIVYFYDDEGGNSNSSGFSISFGGGSSGGTSGGGGSSGGGGASGSF